MNSNYDVIIIGGGSAGLAAAIKCHELGIKNTLILERDEFLGGILNQCIHNGFGLHEFNEELSGPEYAERFIKALKDRHIDYKLKATVTKITSNLEVFYTSEEGYFCLRAKSIIITVGCYERSAGAINLAGDRPSGIYSAGTAQKYLNLEGVLVGKKIFILGSGDIGLIMARRMTLAGAKVIGVAEIMPYSSGLTRNIVQCLDDFEIPLYLSTTVKRAIGKKHLEAIELVEIDDKFQYIPNTERIIPVDTLLLSVGLIPSVDLLKDLPIKYSTLTRSVIVNEHCETSIPGIFVAGNGLHVHDLVDYVSEEARLAAIGAVRFIRSELKHDGTVISVNQETGISYVVPQIIIYENIEDVVRLKLRVNRPLKNVYIVVKANEVIIKKVFKLGILPSEMENIVLKKNMIPSDCKTISVGLEDKK